MLNINSHDQGQYCCCKFTVPTWSSARMASCCWKTCMGEDGVSANSLESVDLEFTSLGSFNITTLEALSAMLWGCFSTDPGVYRQTCCYNEIVPQDHKTKADAGWLGDTRCVLVSKYGIIWPSWVVSRHLQTTREIWYTPSSDGACRTDCGIGLSKSQKHNKQQSISLLLN